MFKFLKKLFSRLEEDEGGGEDIKVEELEGWFRDRVDKIFSELDVRIAWIKNKVKEEIAKTKDNLSILSTANLHNPKISVRENQFMEGNRKAYVLGVNSFLRGIDFEENNYPSLLNFCDNFAFRLEKFGKSTFRSYHILQEFFANESRDIAINIKDLDDLIKELKTAIENAKIDKINEIKDSIIDLTNKIKQKNEFEERLKDKEKVKQGLMKNKEEIEKEIEKLMKSREYKQLNDLKANKEVLLASIREHNAKIVHAFSVMEKPLRKLVRVMIEDSDLLERYIENPVNTLISDTEFKILILLRKLGENINNLTLELKDKKREKVLETVKGLTEEFLGGFVNKHNELNKKLERLEKEINENEALKRENKLNYELGEINDDSMELDNEIENNNRELEKMDIDEIKNKLENGIKGLLKIEVVIS